MEVHHLNCGVMEPRGARLLLPQLARVPCNCLLLEAGGQLVLVDTGLGTRDMEDPGRLGPGNALLNALPQPERTALSQVEALGFRPGDVSHIVCTHLDRDHAGGLADFPNARVHVSSAERDAALNPRGRRELERYRSCHFEHGPHWVAYGDGPGEDWFGLVRLEGMEGLPPGISLVPLHGHTRGHCGVALETGEGWLLHCGDAYYLAEELDEGWRVPIGLRSFRRVAHIDHSRAMEQLAGLRELARERGGETAMLASHDPGGMRDV